MIDFSYNDQQVKAALDQNQDYINLVRKNAIIGHIQIQVDNGHIILFRNNNNDTFVAYLLADELYYYRNTIDDIRRIANLMENFATEEYRRNNP